MENNFGKIRIVDLTTRDISEVSSEEYESRFIGGRGVGAWFLFREMSQGIDYSDPESVIVISTGPLSGTLFPCSGRTSISAKNVMTGGVNWTNIGGSFGAELRRTGSTHIVIRGKSELPVYLYVSDGSLEIRNALHLWGVDIWETERTIRQELGDSNIQSLCIGRAGENLVPMAAVISDRTRAAGSGGIGCVFGSKKLKAVAARGTQKIPIAHPKAFKVIVKKVYSRLASSEFSRAMFEQDCLVAPIKRGNDLCTLPVRNTQDDHFEDLDNSSVAPNKWLQLRSGKTYRSCYRCPIGCCDHLLEVKEGPFKGLKINTPKNNTFVAYAARLGMRTPSNILKVYELLSRYGLDQDSAGVAISWAFECYERGIITGKDTDGLDLTWGNDLSVIALISKIANKEGFGAILSNGCKRASEIIKKGSEYYCTHLKGQDNLDALRALKAWGFGNVVSLRGGRHLDGSPTTEFSPSMTPQTGERLFGVGTAFDPTTYEGKGRLTAWTSKFKAVVDSVGICYFATYWGTTKHCGPEDLAEAMSSVTGRKILSDELMRIGERIINIEKAFNTIHAGFLRKDDYPPLIYMKEPIKTGQFKGELISREGHDRMLDEFYAANGWDKQTSWQYEEALRQLDLLEVAEQLGRVGRLPRKTNQKVF